MATQTPIPEKSPEEKRSASGSKASKPARRDRADLRRQASAAGFAEGSRMLAPLSPAGQDTTRASAQSGPGTVSATVNETIQDTPYGWQSRFDVSFNDKECLITIRMKIEALEAVSAEDVAKVQAEASAAFLRFFDNKFRLIDRKTNKAYAMRVGLVWSDKDPHLVVKLRKGKGRDTVSNWFVQSDPIVRAHELGHQLGLKDEYIDPSAANRKDENAPGVKTDNSLMGNFWAEGVSTASVKTRHAQDIANRIGAATGNTYNAEENR